MQKKISWNYFLIGHWKVQSFIIGHGSILLLKCSYLYKQVYSMTNYLWVGTSESKLFFLQFLCLIHAPLFAFTSKAEGDRRKRYIDVTYAINRLHTWWIFIICLKIPTCIRRKPDIKNLFIPLDHNGQVVLLIVHFCTASCFVFERMEIETAFLFIYLFYKDIVLCHNIFSDL